MLAPLCLEDEESLDHLLLKCNFANRIWSVVLGWFRCSWVLPRSLSDLFEAWIFQYMAPRGREMWKLSFLAVIWFIWKERNDRCFKRIASCVDSITCKIQLFVALWVSVIPSFQGIMLDQMVVKLEGDCPLLLDPPPLSYWTFFFPFWLFLLRFSVSFSVYLSCTNAPLLLMKFTFQKEKEKRDCLSFESSLSHA